MISKKVATYIFNKIAISMQTGKPTYKEISNIEVEGAIGSARIVFYGIQSVGFDKEVLIGAFDIRVLSHMIKLVAINDGFNIIEDSNCVKVNTPDGDIFEFTSGYNNFAFERIAAAAEKIVTLLQKP